MSAATDHGGPLSMSASAPIPKPEQPKSDSWLRQFWQDHQAVATIIGALIAAIIAVFVGAAFRPIINVPSGTPPVGPTATSSPSPATAPPNETTTSPTPTPTQTGVSERNTTKGKQLLTLSQGTSADLDSENRNWGAEYAGTEPRFD